MLDRRAEREYNRLVDAAVDAVPADAPGMLRKVMGPDIKQALTYGAKNHSQELRLMAHLWALMGYQEAVRRLCEALIFNGVHCTEGPDAPNSASRAALSWPAEYTNLIGYAHLFNRTTTADHDLAKEFDPSYSSEFEGTRELMGTPDRPGPAFWTVGKDLVRIVLGEMAEMSIYRLSSVGNDIGWDRARFDQELETDAHAMRVVLADSNQRPTLSQDLNINLPEGFTGFHDNIGPNEPVPELRHLPPPQPLPVGLFPAGWFTAPDPAATPGDTGSSEAAGDVPISEPERQGPLPPMNPKDIGSVWDHIEALLGDDAEDMLNPGADDDSISDLEARLGRELPAPMRKSLERHNGMTEEHEALPGTRLLSTGDILDEWEVNNDAYEDVNDEARDRPEVPVGFAPGTTQPGIWNSAWIPITADGMGNNFVVDLSPGPRGTNGQILTINHDQPHTGPIHPHVTALLAEWAANLND